MGNSYFTSEGGATGVQFTEKQMVKPEFVTFITNDLTADPEISFAGNFYYPVPSHLIGKGIGSEKIFLKMDFPFKFPSRKDRKRLLSHQILHCSLYRAVVTFVYKR